MRLTTLARRGRRLAFLALAWLTLGAALACGGGEGVGRRETGMSITAGDSLAARAVSDNAREQAALKQATLPPDAGAASDHASAAASGFGATIGFRSQRRLDEHYAKHGSEFGRITKAEYLRRAQQLRDAPVEGDVLELRRPDGTTARFDRGTGAFIAFDSDGTIRTFFRPNDGESYFRRQARRRAARD